MDLIKKLTGKNPDEYEAVAKNIIDNSDVALFAKLVKQDDFLFDFVKNNVACRLRKACNKDNYTNVLNFFDYYSSSYDEMFAGVLFDFGGEEILPLMKEIFISGNDSKKAYVLKYFALLDMNNYSELLDSIRSAAFSEYEPLSINAIEILSKVNDEEFKNSAIKFLNSQDEFEQYDGVKYLVNFKAKDMLPQIIEVMKQSSLSENIASEIPFLMPVEDLIKNDDGILVMCNIINAIPEILPPSAVLSYNLYDVLEMLYKTNLTSSTALLLMLAKEKFEELTSNEEYLFDCDKNTKDEVTSIGRFLSKINASKLKSLFYDELYDESNFVIFALDFVEEKEELEALLDSKNPTIILKVLGIMKELNYLNENYKNIALNIVEDENLRMYIKAL